jgi:hypothetical protein
MESQSQSPSPSPINYLYFGGLFALLVFVSAGSIFTRENLSGSRIFFFLYAIGQSILETLLLILLGLGIRRFLGKVSFTLFTGLTFIVALLHVLDFGIGRVLDLSIFEAFRVFVLDETWENFIYLLDATGLSLLTWALIAFGIVAVPFLGYFLYHSTNYIAQKKPLLLPREWIFQAFLCIPCALFLWDFSASNVIHPDSYAAFIKSLPWKVTFFHPQNVLITPKAPLRTPLSEAALTEAIEKEQTTLTKKPNIYLFVIESLREDCITPEGAPNLYQFKNEYTRFDLSLSNGNGSHLSWFSIFHSQFPYLWSQLQKMNWKMGSPPLKLLKKWGYQIRLYTSAQLAYYGMENLLFGDNSHLLDSNQSFHHRAPLLACDTDRAAVAKLKKDLTENPELQEGQLFIVFLDGTHFDYSWPKEWEPRFKPYAKEFAYFKTFHSEENIQLIKNRYRNAVHYTDHLFGEFFQSLPKKEEAIIVVTGDHGEEFFEHGHLFHNSHISHEQTNIPLYFKFGENKRGIPNRKIVSQMDIFNSVVDYLSGSPVPFLEGHSIFQKDRWPFAITARFNGGQTPYEFSIHNGNHKMIARFLNHTDIFGKSDLLILSLMSCKDKTLPECQKIVNEWIETEFGEALERLFPRR